MPDFYLPTFLFSWYHSPNEIFCLSQGNHKTENTSQFQTVGCSDLSPLTFGISECDTCRKLTQLLRSKQFHHSLPRQFPHQCVANIHWATELQHKHATMQRWHFITAFTYLLLLQLLFNTVNQGVFIETLWNIKIIDHKSELLKIINDCFPTGCSPILWKKKSKTNAKLLQSIRNISISGSVIGQVSALFPVSR